MVIRCDSGPYISGHKVQISHRPAKTHAGTSFKFSTECRFPPYCSYNRLQGPALEIGTSSRASYGILLNYCSLTKLEVINKNAKDNRFLPALDETQLEIYSAQGIRLAATQAHVRLSVGQSTTRRKSAVSAMTLETMRAVENATFQSLFSSS